MRCIWGMRIQYNCIKGSYCNVRIKRKHIFMVPAIMTALALLVALIIRPKNFTVGHYLVIPATFAALAGIAGFLSLLAVAIVQKLHWEIRIYFFGQLAVPVFLIGLIVYLKIDSVIYNNTRANIEGNRSFISHHTNKWEDTLYLRALVQLETVVENDNDIDLDYSNIVTIDTVVNGYADSATIILFGYRHKGFPGQVLCSKHLVGRNYNQLIFFNEPLTHEVKIRMRELRKNAFKNMQKLKDLYKELKEKADTVHLKEFEELFKEMRDMGVDTLFLNEQ
jgi:hypothetical protein